jgi:hypothetical protein
LTSNARRVDILSMGSTAAVQRGLFGEDYEVIDAPEVLDGWRGRADALMRYSQERGGLVPQRALPDVLGISRQRVHELVQSSQFEVIKIEEIAFVTGRSIDAWEKDSDKVKGGWRSRRGTVWERVKVSVKIGADVGDAVAGK